MSLSSNTNQIGDSRLLFSRDNRFQVELRHRVDEYFRRTGRRQRDCPEMYLKTGILLTVFGGLYGLLVFATTTWWQALPIAFLLGLSMAVIGFNVQHEGGHQAYSNHGWINRLMASTLGLIGGSSSVWHWKQAGVHHPFPNSKGHDADIDFWIRGRVS